MQTERQVAREQLVTARFEGCTFQEVSTESPVPLKRAMAKHTLSSVTRLLMRASHNLKCKRCRQAIVLSVHLS